MTPRQAIFVAQYLIHGNATLAAKDAGYSETSAHVTGARLLKMPKVAAAIAAARARQVEKLELTADRVLLEFMRLAYFDPGKLYDQNGKRIPVGELDEDTRRAVAAVEDGIKDGARFQRVKMADKGSNLAWLAKHLKLFGDDKFGATVETSGGMPADSTIKIVLVRPAA